ncbi:MAG: hypothetical protein O3A47_01120 [Chloroflexi bacterium]|nr:hypothetical protein [Chloroflexota bacterium]
MDTAETIAMIRDIVFLVTLVMMSLAILMISVKVVKVLNRLKSTLDDVESIVSMVSEKLVFPAAAGSGVAFGVGKVAAFLAGARRSKKKDKDEKK